MSLLYLNGIATSNFTTSYFWKQFPFCYYFFTSCNAVDNKNNNNNIFLLYNYENVAAAEGERERLRRDIIVITYYYSVPTRLYKSETLNNVK